MGLVSGDDWLDGYRCGLGVAALSADAVADTLRATVTAITVGAGVEALALATGSLHGLASALRAYSACVRLCDESGESNDG